VLNPDVRIGRAGFGSRSGVGAIGVLTIASKSFSRNAGQPGAICARCGAHSNPSSFLMITASPYREIGGELGMSKASRE